MQIDVPPTRTDLQAARKKVKLLLDEILSSDSARSFEVATLETGLKRLEEAIDDLTQRD